jgi:L-seryl-tRNA(Ser) seleniumtransferase
MGMRGRDPNAPAKAPAPEHRHRGNSDNFGFAVWQLKEGEDKIIADRLVEIFSQAPKA